MLRRGTVRHVTSFILLDAATVRFRYSNRRSAIEARNGVGDVLAAIDINPGMEDSHAAAAVLDHALISSRLQLGDAKGRLALYHPWTAQLSLKMPRKPVQVFTDHNVIEIPIEGVLAELDGDILRIGDRSIPAFDPYESFETLTETFAAACR